MVGGSFNGEADFEPGQERPELTAKNNDGSIAPDNTYHGAIIRLSEKGPPDDQRSTIVSCPVRSTRSPVTRKV